VFSDDDDDDDGYTAYMYRLLALQYTVGETQYNYKSSTLPFKTLT